MAVDINGHLEEQDINRLHSQQSHKRRVVARSIAPIAREPVVRASAESQVQQINSNPLVSRTDMVRLLHDLISPLEAPQSPGGARIKLGHSGAGFDPVAAELEGYARALWGLGPLLASEPDHPLFADIKIKWVRGLSSGTDPEHPEYWGDCQDRDQRMVEQAAIVSPRIPTFSLRSKSLTLLQSVSIAIAPGVFWIPLSSVQKARVNTWLMQGNGLVYPASNWRCELCFRISLYIS